MSARSSGLSKPGAVEDAYDPENLFVFGGYYVYDGTRDLGGTVRTTARPGDKLQFLRHMWAVKEEYTEYLFRAEDGGEVRVEVYEYYRYHWRSEDHEGAQWGEVMSMQFVFVSPPDEAYRREPGDSPEPVRLGWMSKLLAWMFGR